MTAADGTAGEAPAGAAAKANAAGLATRAIGQILTTALEGAGPFRGAADVADEVRVTTGDSEKAVDRLVVLHLRLAAANGALTGLGGVATLPITVPAGVSGYFIVAGRLVAGVAHLRGHDLGSEDVRTAVLLTMAGGGAATEILREAGVEIGKRGAAAAVKRVSGKTLIDINKKVGFRLLTKGGTTGVINLGKMVPFVGAPIGATTDLLSMRTVAAYAKSSFPSAATETGPDREPTSPAPNPHHDVPAKPATGAPVHVSLEGQSSHRSAAVRRLKQFRARDDDDAEMPG